MNVHIKPAVNSQTVWDEETKARMAMLWNNGQSAAQVAAVFGISRNVIIGLAHRNTIFKVKGRGAPSVPKRPRLRLEKPKRPRAPQTSKATHAARIEAVKREAIEFKAGTSRYLQIHPSDEERLGNGKTLLDLGRHECKWPLNLGGPFLFCAEETGGTTYCGHHAQRSAPRE